MIGDDGLDLSTFRAALSLFHIRVAARLIRPGDEAAFDDPTHPATSANLGRRRASGAARIAARGLLVDLGGGADAPLRRGANRAPVWPAGFVGSLAHDEDFAIAAAVSSRDIAMLGVDIEPAEPLPEDILGFALSETERTSIALDAVKARAIFSCKEAVYKAVNPFDGSPLEYEDIEVSLARARATLRDGRVLRLVVDVGPRVLVAAYAFQGAPPPG